MLFNSFTFLIFFAVVLALHYLPLPWKWKKFNLLWASYLFYAAWNPPFVILLWISTLADWFVAKRLHETENRAARRLLLLVSLGINLGMLGFFKYGDFLLRNFTALLAALNINYVPPEFDVVLPVGISFYTFQTLSYTIDVYRRRMKPWHSFLDYALYVTFFPQLVAGPIVRATEFLPQCIEPCRARAREFGWGLCLLLLGLFQKIVVADGLLAPIAERVYPVEATQNMVADSLAAWCATLAFAGQIFCDFAGYSTCAIGVAMCLGFGLPDNFRFPYAAVGFSDFWRRWHISLSSWLRDYLYIPLGGNRHGELRTFISLMLTMLIGGLWHGPAWTFVVWGGLHGLYLIVERILKAKFSHLGITEHALGKFFLGMLTFALVCFTWVFFRAKSFDQAFQVCGAMLGIVSLEPTVTVSKIELLLTAVTMSSILATHWLMRDRSLEEVANRCPWWLRSIIIATMLILIATMPGEDRAFIYFQF